MPHTHQKNPSKLNGQGFYDPKTVEQDTKEKTINEQMNISNMKRKLWRRNQLMNGNSTLVLETNAKFKGEITLKQQQ